MAGICNCSLLAIAIYLFAVYFPSTIQISLGSPELASGLIFIVTLLTALACPLMGKLTDRYGIRTFYKSTIILFMLISPIILMLSSQESLLGIAIGYVAFGLMCATLTGTIFSMLADSFDDDVRYSGITIAFNLSMTIFGSSAPIIALWFSQNSIGFSLVPFYLVAASCIAYIGLYLSSQEKITV
jgi:MHS family proline/betaine transporter-like MFS transporter